MDPDSLLGGDTAGCLAARYDGSVVAEGSGAVDRAVSDIEPTGALGSTASGSTDVNGRAPRASDPVASDAGVSASG